MSKTVFIHIPKNAGVAIRMNQHLKNKIIFAEKHQLQPGYYENYLNKMKEINEAQGVGHVRWRDLNDQLKALPSFAIIRNPWAKVVSRFYFAKNIIKDPKTKWDNTYANVSSFEAFLEDRHKWGGVPYLWGRAVKGWYNQLEHVKGDDNKSVVCDIIRFEDLNNDIRQYFNIDHDIKWRNVTTMEGPKKILRGDSYKNEYNNNTIQIIADWYKEDIDYWGFDFDTGATKNYWAYDK